MICSTTFVHEIDGILRLALVCSLGISIEQVSNIRPRSKFLDHPQKAPRHGTLQREVRELVIDVSVDDHHVVTGLHGIPYHDSEMHGVKKVETMARDS